MVAAPLNKPETAAATIRVFIECFIVVIPPFQAWTRRNAPVGDLSAACEWGSGIRLQHPEDNFHAEGGLEPSVAQPPLPLQLFLALQPLSLLLQPPWPLQSFLPLHECLLVS